MLSPQSDANRRLLKWLIATLAAMPAVEHVLGFGSFARQQHDRWSDIDLLVVTEQREQFGQVFQHLSVQKPVLYRSTFTPQIEPGGGRILGIVFKGESVFHSLDLNFMTSAEFTSPDALARFGTLVAYDITAMPKVSLSRTKTLVEDFEPDAEKRVAEGLHFVKKKLKQQLRGSGSEDDLAQWRNQLQDALEAYQTPQHNPRGEITQVAQVYVDMATRWLARHRQR